MAENLVLKQQLMVLRRARKRAPNLTSIDRLLCAFWSVTPIYRAVGRHDTARISRRCTILDARDLERKLAEFQLDQATSSIPDSVPVSGHRRGRSARPRT
jgi:hypothetical protein